MATLFAAQPGNAQPGALAPGDPGSAAPGTGGGGGLTITTMVLPNGEVGFAYNTALMATGGTGPYTWLLGGALLPTFGLPPGLSLGSGGGITGTPTTAGSFSFGVTVQDSAGHSAQATLAITVTAVAVSEYDSLIIADHIELLGGSVPSTNPACAGAVFSLQPG